MIKKILIIGSGSIGLRHLKTIKNLNSNHIVKFFRFYNRKKKIAGSDGDILNLEEAITFMPHIAVIANPSIFHVDFAIKLIPFCKNIFIEKPISNSLEEANKLFRYNLKYKRNIFLGYNLRFRKSLEKFKSIIDGNRLGSILAIKSEVGQYLPDWRPGSVYSESVSAQKSLGGGVILELSHEIDYLIWIFGSIINVYASFGRFSDLDVDVEDSAQFIFGILRDRKEITCTLSLDFIRRDVKRCCEVICENGTIKWDGVADKVSIFYPKSKIWVDVYNSPSKIDESYIREWRHTLKMSNQKINPSITMADGIAVLKVIEAAKKSNAKLKKIYLNE